MNTSTQIYLATRRLEKTPVVFFCARKSRVRCLSLFLARGCGYSGGDQLAGQNHGRTKKNN